MNNKVAIFILLGQSNAVGFGNFMSEEEKIKEPLKNVFGLHRSLNQSFDNDKLFWSGYTSSGMNLGETHDDTFSVANCMASLWQKEIDEGADLPDLYIIHISVGAQGVAEKNSMWSPDYDKILVPGTLGNVKIALLPLTEHILSLVKPSIEKMGKELDYVGLHWRGGEQDTLVPVEHLKKVLKDIYISMLDRFYNAVGRKIPVVMHNITHEEASKRNNEIESFHYINETFEEISKENENVKIFEVRKAHFYNENVYDRGIFKEDAVHYTSKTNKWVAEQIVAEYKARNFN